MIHIVPDSATAMNEFESHHAIVVGISHERIHDGRLVAAGLSSSSWSPQKWKKPSRCHHDIQSKVASPLQRAYYTIIPDDEFSARTPTTSNKRHDRRRQDTDHIIILQQQQRQPVKKTPQQQPQQQHARLACKTIQVPLLAPLLTTHVPPVLTAPKQGFAAFVEASQKVVIRGRRHTFASNRCSTKGTNSSDVVRIHRPPPPLGRPPRQPNHNIYPSQEQRCHEANEANDGTNTTEPPLVKLKEKSPKPKQKHLHPTRASAPRRHTMTCNSTHDAQQQLEDEQEEELRYQVARHNTWYFSSNHVLVNRERTMRGLIPLKRNIRMDGLAREAAATMAECCGNMKQLDDSPYHGNVVRGKSIRAMHQQIMSLLTSNERANILNSSFSDFGVGTCKGGDGQLYLCQFFDTCVDEQAGRMAEI